MALDVRGVSYRWPQEQQGFKDINLKVPKASLLTITGPSGCGKTLLLDLLSGVRRPDSGTIHLMGFGLSPATAFTRRRLRRRLLHYCSQGLHLLPHLTILENVAAAQFFQGSIDFAAARRALQTLGLGHAEGSRPSQLSGGERQRVRIAQSLVSDTPVLLMDEPTSHLDRDNTLRCLEFLSQEQQKFRTVVIVSQDKVLLSRVPKITEMKEIAG